MAKVSANVAGKFADPPSISMHGMATFFSLSLFSPTIML